MLVQRHTVTVYRSPYRSKYSVWHPISISDRRFGSSWIRVHVLEQVFCHRWSVAPACPRLRECCFSVSVSLCVYIYTYIYIYSYICIYIYKNIYYVCSSLPCCLMPMMHVYSDCNNVGLLTSATELLSTRCAWTTSVTTNMIFMNGYFVIVETFRPN